MCCVWCVYLCVSLLAAAWGRKVDYATTSHPSSYHLTSFLYAIILYTQDVQYFPAVTCSVTHRSIVSYRMITHTHTNTHTHTHTPWHTHTNTPGWGSDEQVGGGFFLVSASWLILTCRLTRILTNPCIPTICWLFLHIKISRYNTYIHIEKQLSRDNTKHTNRKTASGRARASRQPEPLLYFRQLFCPLVSPLPKISQRALCKIILLK